MLLVLAIIFVFIILIYRFPYLSFFIALAFISYPYLMTKYNTSANLLDVIIKAFKNWVKTGTIDIPNFEEIANQLPEDAFTQNIYDISSEKTDILDADIKNENIRKVFVIFPELELYQKWLFEQQEYYIDYQYDIFAVWKKILDKIVDIISNPNSYAANNITDLLNLEGQLLQLVEFKNMMSLSTSPDSALALMVDEIITRNRKFNTNLVKWIKNNRGKINIRGCATIDDFEAEDWVAPSNLMKLR